MLNRDDFVTAEVAGPWCFKCGESVPAGWRFCRSCGAMLISEGDETADNAVLPIAPVDVTFQNPFADPSPAEDQVPAPATSAAPFLRRLWVRQSAAGVVAAVVLVAGGLGIKDDVQTHRSLTGTQATLSTTRSTLRSTRANLDSTKADLDSTKANLASTQADLASTQADLASTQATLSSTKGQLTSTTQQLGSANQQLAGAKSTVNQQASQLQANATEIGNLGTCLNGVLNAISAGANGDFSTEDSILNSITSACQSGLQGLP